jgi:hypothetical protein
MFHDVKTVEVSADKNGVNMVRGVRIFLKTKPCPYINFKTYLCVCVCLYVCVCT